MKNNNDIEYIFEKLSSRYPNYSNKPQHNDLIHDIQRKSISVALNFLRDVYNDAKQNCHSVILSGEDFENCIVDLAFAEEIETAAKQCGFVTVTWIVITRDQIDLINSLYSDFDFLLY